MFNLTLSLDRLHCFFGGSNLDDFRGSPVSPDVFALSVDEWNLPGSVQRVRSLWHPGRLRFLASSPLLALESV